MSNLLEKLFILEYTLVPGYTTRVWHPAVTTTTTRIWGYDSNGAKVYAQESDGYFGSTSNASYPVYFLYSRVVVNNDGTTLIYEEIQTQGSETFTETTPGYYTYDVQPDVYEVSYSPNLGWNSSARSISTILGDGSSTFSVRQDEVGAVVGLNELGDSSGQDYFEITYGLYFTRGFVRVVESGTIKTSALPYLTTDVFTVSRTDSAIYYAQNDVVFYKSLLTSDEELLLDASLYAGGDAVYDAALSDVSNVVEASASMTAVATFSATPKAAASLTATSSMGFTGIYSIDGDIHAAVDMTAVSDMVVTKQFASSAMTATSTMTATGHHVNEFYGTMPAMTALATTGYPAYAEINATMPAMSAYAGVSVLSNDFIYIGASMPPMQGNVNGLAGVASTAASLATMPAMTALAADHAYAEINATMPAMTAFSGDYPDLGNYITIGLPTYTLRMNGHTVAAKTIESRLPTYTLSLTGGAAISSRLPDYTLAAVGTYAAVGDVTIRLPVYTLDMAGTAYDNGSVTARLPRMTLSLFGGAEVAARLPTYTLTSTATAYPSGNISSRLPTYTMTATGSEDIHGAIQLRLIEYVSTNTRITARLPAYTLTLTGSEAIANAVAYVLNIRTGESTRYTNYAFDYIINVGDRQVGVTSTALYWLEGTTDNGTAINGTITTKDSDHGVYNSKRLSYIYMDSDTQTTITPYYDGVANKPVTSAFGGRRTKMAMGPSGRYIQLKVAGIQSLQGMEILTENLQRRVK